MNVFPSNWGTSVGGRCRLRTHVSLAVTLRTAQKVQLLSVFSERSPRYGRCLIGVRYPNTIANTITAGINAENDAVLPRRLSFARKLTGRRLSRPLQVLNNFE